jgi:RNA polymerase I-specific transcription initiation factor RRN3
MDGRGVHVEVPTNVKHIQDMVSKLDAILTLLFEHFQRTSEAVSASNSSRPLSPLELLPLPPLSTSTPSLSNSHTASFGGSSTPLSPTLSSQQPQQISTTPVPHTEQYLRLQFQALLSIFDRIILRTFKSRYTQFLIFWYTSLDPQFADIFQGMLVDRALLGGGVDQHHYGGSATTEDGDKSATMNAYMVTPELTRAAAASYIGSFVSRATFVDREGARRVVGVLCEFLNAHLESVEQSLRAGWAGVGGDGTSFLTTTTTTTQGQHTVFYAVTQAVFLIFCFRWRDLVDDEDMGDDDDQLRLSLDSNETITGRTRKPISTNKSKWIPELGILKRVVVSMLNPLKVCVCVFLRFQY